MKTLSLIILVLFLLQPLACFTHVCDSSMGNPDVADTPCKSGSHSHSQDADSCDSTVCCAEYTSPKSGISVVYLPLVSEIVVPQQYQKLPNVVIPIFVPPQSLS
jgi:hypothetical protein